jgi:hypothetical protein
MSIRSTLAIAAVFIMVSGSFYTYYKVSSYKISTLTEANSKLNFAVTEQKAAIDSIQTKYQKQANTLSVLITSNSTLSKEKEELSNKLMKHDLEELSRRKPIMVEKRINDGTKELFSSFTNLSTE